MRKRRESDQQKPKETEISSERICCIVLFLVVLCSWMIPSIAVYGFDVSGMDSFGGIIGYVTEPQDKAVIFE